MKIIVSILFIISIICISCLTKNDSQSGENNRFVSPLSKDELKKLSESKQKFAFLRMHAPDEKRIAMDYGFGDIFVYNLPDSTLYRLTDDNDFEDNLCWSPDGTKILFASSRDHFDWHIHDNSQAMAVTNLFYIDLNTGLINQIYFLNTEISVAKFNGLTWTKSGIYFSDYDNKIYRLNEYGDSLSIFLDTHEECKITEISFSQNGKYLAFGASPFDFNEEFKIGLYDIANKELKWILRKSSSFLLSGWNNENTSFFFTRKDTLVQYNILNGIESPFKLLGSTNKLRIAYCFYISNEEVVYISSDNPYKDYSGKIREAKWGVAIGIENIITRQLRYPIYDNHVKDDLAVYYSR
ncbi:MAG: hypothetical protein V1720_01980 [bacterium]